MLWRIAAAQFLGMTLWFSATAAAPAIVREFQLTSGASAWLTMAVQAGFVAGTLASAMLNLADAINPRRLFAAGCAVGALANAMIVLAPSSTTIIVLRFVTGMALACVYPPGMKLTAGWFLERRGWALGVVVGALTMGSAFPHLLAWLASSTGSGEAPVLSWRLLLGSSSALALASGAIVIGTVSDGPHVTASAPFDIHAVRHVLRSRGVRLATLGYLGHMWELYAMWAWIAVYAAHSLSARGDAVRAAPLVAFVTIASGAVGCVAAGKWGDRWGKARVAGAAMIASAASSALAGLVYGQPLAALLVLAIVWGFSVVADSAQFSALVSEHSPRTLVGTALTLQTSVGFFLTMISMRLVPLIAESAGWRWVFLLLVPGPVLGAMAMSALSARTDGVPAAYTKNTKLRSSRRP
jgi:MFS family permease